MSAPYYRMFPREWDDGTACLTLEEEGALLRICNTINSRGQYIPDTEESDREMMHRCRVSMRKWKTLKAALVAAGKISIRDGKIYQAKAMAEIAHRAEIAENGAKGGRKRAENLAKTARKPAENSLKTARKSFENDRADNENSDLSQANQNHIQNHITDTDVSVRGSSPPEPDVVAQAVAIYREVCVPAGMPDVIKITDRRRSALKARLRDCEGMDGWRRAMLKARDSPFLRGDNDRNWRADFDFLTRDSSFTKLMEGGYDGNGHNRGGAGRSGSVSGSRSGSLVDAAAQLWAEADD